MSGIGSGRDATQVGPLRSDGGQDAEESTQGRGLRSVLPTLASLLLPEFRQHPARCTLRALGFLPR